MSEAKKPAQPGPQSGQENREAADKATQDNDLTTGHSDPEDGGADNARPKQNNRDS
jgi:hypothetical protein